MPHLKAGNSEATSVVGWSDNRDEVRAVWDVLIVELHRNLIITWRHKAKNM